MTDKIDIAVENARATARENVQNLNKALATMEKLRKIGQGDRALEAKLRQEIARQKQVEQVL